MNYREYVQIRQEGISALPLFFAFGNEQFKQAMEERGLTENDTDKIYSIGAGGYFLKKDADVVRAFFNKKDELPELMEDYDFAFDAFYYEMGNHEYHINYQGDWDVINCFYSAEWLGDGADAMDYLNKLDISNTTKQAYLNAREKFLNDANENDWY